MTRLGLLIGCVLVIAGCGDADSSDQTPSAERTSEPSVLEPLVQTLERAEGVQRAIDERAAEQRRRIDEDEQ